MYFSGQGKIFLAPVVAGVTGAFRWVDNVPAFKLSPETSQKDHKESWSGQRLLDKILTTENKVKFMAELESWAKENLALAIRSEPTTVAGGSVTVGTPWSAPDDLVVGDVIALPNQKLSAITVKDSAGSPATVPDTNVEVDAVYGTATIKDLGSFTQPFTFAYTYGTTTSVPFFKSAIKEVALRFQGINTADGNAPVLVELYKISLDPTKELGLISDDFEKFTLEGSALIDATRPDDPVLGRFGRFVYL